MQFKSPGVLSGWVLYQFDGDIIHKARVCHILLQMRIKMSTKYKLHYQHKVYFLPSLIEVYALTRQ